MRLHQARAVRPLDLISGTEDGDYLEGGSGNDTIDAGGGDDIVYGWGGIDQLRGGDGADQVYGGSFGDRLSGGDGDDTLAGEGGQDWLRGQAGADYLEGGNGDDTLDGGAGTDAAIYTFFDLASGATLDASALNGTGAEAVVDAGSAGIDLLRGVERIYAYGSAHADLLVAGGGVSILEGGAGDDTLDGGDGDDRLSGQEGNDRLRGGSGVDVAMYNLSGGVEPITFYGSAMAGDGAEVALADGFGTTDVLFGIESLNVLGSSLNDTLQGSGGNDTLFGFSGNDSLTGGAGQDYLNGYTGDDVLGGGLGDDFLYGSGGIDTLDGGAGTDIAVFFLTGAGLAFSAAALGTDATVVLPDGRGSNDTFISIEAAEIHGTTGADTLTGSGGDDVIEGGIGNDQLDGAGGHDVLRFDFSAAAGPAVLQLSGLGGATDLAVDAGELGSDTVSGFEAAWVAGSAHADRLVGSGAGDTLAGAGGEDVLSGGIGDDLLQGDDGADRLSGGAGNDTLAGGEGADRFVLRASSNGASADTVVDFVTGTDQLLLRGGAFDALGAGRLDAGAFVLGVAAAEADDRIVYDPDTGGLYYDADGTGDGAAVLLALLGPGTDLAATDIWVS